MCFIQRRTLQLCGFRDMDQDHRDCGRKPAAVTFRLAARVFSYAP